jgi:hypothetical protein
MTDAIFHRPVELPILEAEKKGKNFLRFNRISFCS